MFKQIEVDEERNKYGDSIRQKQGAVVELAASGGREEGK